MRRPFTRFVLFAWPVIVVPLLMACAQAKKINQSLSGPKVATDLTYPRGGDADSIRGHAVVGSFIVEQELDSATRTESVGRFILPLLLFNYWRYHFEVDFGRNRLDAHLARFGRTNLSLELLGAGYRQSSDTGMTRVDVTVTEIWSRTGYVRSGWLFTTGFTTTGSSSEYASNPESGLTARVTLTKGGKSRSFDFSHEENAVIDYQKGGRDYRVMVVSGVGNSLAACFQKLNQHIVAEMAKPWPP